MYSREASLDMEIGDYARAQKRLDAVPDKDRDDSWRVVESRYLELTGHLSAARPLLQTAGAYVNANVDAPAQQRAWYFFREGEMAFEAGDNDEALADERQAIAIFPHYADGFRVLARVECALKQWTECLRDATTSADMVPYPETLGYEADAQRALGQGEAAAGTDGLIRTVERIGNAQRISDRLLAIYYSEHGLHADDAYAIARRELSARDDIFTEDTLAWAAAADGRWDVARTAIRKALRFDTENSLLQYHAGMIALHFGDRAEAKRRLARALALNGQFHQVYADRARATLATL
jgi:tetratricopeptide (TPR) repeat protein